MLRMGKVGKSVWLVRKDFWGRVSVNEWTGIIKLTLEGLEEKESASL